MDPNNTAEILKHLEKQKELLEDVHRNMSHELHTLQVEEEMLMRKFYDITSALGLNKKNEVSRMTNDLGNKESMEMDNTTSEGQ